MVFIPNSIFQMGSTEAEIEAAIDLCQQHYYICNRWYYERESPLHSVSLNSFWIDQTEVSNAQYRLCVETGICAEPTTCKKGEPTFGDPINSQPPSSVCQLGRSANLLPMGRCSVTDRGGMGIRVSWRKEIHLSLGR